MLTIAPVIAAPSATFTPSQRHSAGDGGAMYSGATAHAVSRLAERANVLVVMVRDFLFALHCLVLMTNTLPL